MAMLRNVGTTLEMIKWEHSVFALPFALTGAMLAARGIPTLWQLGWIVVAMVAARSAAMAFNRLADAGYDAENPRTCGRALPAGRLTRPFVAGFVVVSAAIFVAAAAQLNRLCLVLSPVALAVLLLYSYAKRFTRWSHIWLGFADAIPPAGAWIAVRGTLDTRILLLVAAVTFWVGGFDMLYACQDYENDRRTGLHSIPRFYGIRRALLLARLAHVVTVAALAGTVIVFGMGTIAWVGAAVFAALIVYEHSLVKPGDLSRLNAAFFTTNGVVSVLLFLFMAADILRRR
jgi:4-hydroxybenzoate polyprenyltransferase